MNDGFVKTGYRIDIDDLQDWYLNLRETVASVQKDTTFDYAKDYFVEGSAGYGWALHEFADPEGVERVWWRNPDTKSDPMIRSKGRITFENGDKCFIGNEHFTQRTSNCDGYMGTILDKFPEAYRGAVWAMKPGFKFVEHIDYPNNETYRIHVVLDTNPKAMFKFGEQVRNMPADGYLWMVNTGDVIHTAWNYGDTDRAHIHWQMPIESWDHYLNKLG